VKHGAALATGPHIDEADLPEELLAPQPTAAPDATTTRATSVALRSLADVEREHILHVLDACDGSQADAARVLGIARNTLWRKLREYRGD
jgi:two-component system response regulator HydG